MWWEYRELQRRQGLEAASWHTFHRALRQMKLAGLLRFRKTGCHAKCTECELYKKDLRTGSLSLQARAQVMERYTTHVVEQWLDRQVYENMQDLARSCLSAWRDGYRWQASALSSSALTVIADGMDQAKFRVPRQLVHSHAFERLLRPALHVQGIWAHGAGYQLAVSDCDVMKDTAGNLEVLCRLLSDIYAEFGTLPLGLHLQQDNTSRECKNQKVLQFAIMLVAKRVFRWVCLSYLVTGHTHTGLDATFGQLATKLSSSEFSTDVDVVRLLGEFAKDLGVDKASQAAAKCYKLDEVAPWCDWASEIGVYFNNITGPDAPHYLRVCLRSDLGNAMPVPHASKAESAQEPSGAVGDCPPQADDVVLVVKPRMHSLRVSQVIRVFPATLRHRIFRRPEPEGLHPRREGGEKVKEKVARTARALCDEGVIDTAARDYLAQWAEGSRPRIPRPSSYPFLQHRWQREDELRGQSARAGASSAARPVHVAILGLSGQALPHAPEEEADNGVLVEAVELLGPQESR